MSRLRAAWDWIVATVRRKPVTLTTILQGLYALNMERGWVEISSTEFLIGQGMILALFGVSASQTTSNVRFQEIGIDPKDRDNDGNVMVPARSTGDTD